MPHPADTDPEWNYQEWHSAGVKIKVRPRNFERTLQILRTCVALKRSPGFLYLWKGLLNDVPQNPDSDLFLQKVQLYCYIVARIYLHAHLAFQVPTSSSEFEIVLSELWLQIFNYFREHTVEWLKSGLLLAMEINREPSSQEWHQFSHKQNAGIWTFGTLWEQKNY